jgi:hypothetical protein
MSRLLFAGSGQEAAIHKADEGRGLGDSNVKRAGPSQRTQDESLWDSRDEPGLPAGRQALRFGNGLWVNSDEIHEKPNARLTRLLKAVA